MLNVNMASCSTLRLFSTEHDRRRASHRRCLQLL